MPKKQGFRWGFEWGKVGSGLGMVLIGGIGSLVLWYGGVINFWLIGLTVVGVFTMLTGLMGEDGVW